MEVACNGMFGAGNPEMISPPDAKKTFTIQLAEAALLNNAAYQLFIDFDILLSFIKELGKDDQRRYQALFTGNEMVNICVVQATADSMSYNLYSIFELIANAAL